MYRVHSPKHFICSYDECEKRVRLVGFYCSIHKKYQAGQLNDDGTRIWLGTDWVAVCKHHGCNKASRLQGYCKDHLLFVAGQIRADGCIWYRDRWCKPCMTCGVNHV